ncbi:carboxylate--amine ligase [Dermabacter hominis]|uniref:carboxylate--amine ligase n=1 Tax=Dermabacter hominis TaxID=36740 RepID=UPI0021A8BBD5|nr:hypothetical protein [Dermabacter hominis]MCT1717119.1 hypothetical protein [Dermabacter hominis]
MVHTEISPEAATALDIQPVIVGGDIGAYSLARAFHEAYGVKSIVVSAKLGWQIARSAIIDNVLCEDPMDPDVLAPSLTAIAEKIGAERPNAHVIVLGSADATVKSIIRVRDELRAMDPAWTVPYVGLEAFEAGTEKNNFTRLCEKLDVDHPETVIVDLAAGVPDSFDLPFDYPVIAKPADVSAWKRTSFVGKSKVHTVASEQDLRALFAKVHGAGYRKAIIVQDLIPGDDQNMRILTAYCDRDSRIRFASWGRTLLEEHTPGAIGNPAAIVSGVNREAVAQAQKIVSELGWTGYANFDLKYDPRTGRTVFFELNPRLGRSNYYITAAGHNPVTYYVNEHILDALGEPEEIVQDQPETLYTVVPVALVKHYTRDPDSRAILKRVLKARRVKNPLNYRGVEKDPKRWFYYYAALVNYVKKFRTHYKPDTADVQASGEKR